MARVRENDREMQKIKMENCELKADLRIEKELSDGFKQEIRDLKKKLADSEAIIEKVSRGYSFNFF